MSRPTIRSVLGFAMGARYFNPRNWVTSEAYQRGSVVKTAWGNLRSVWRVKKKEECRHETFESAVQRLGLSRADLAARRSEGCKGSRVCYATALLVLLLSGYHALNGNIAGGFGGLAVSVVSAYCGFLRAFRVWQIDTRTLAPFTKFFHAPDAWII